MKKKLLNIINSYKVIIIVLMLLCVFLLMYLNKITSANKIYLFEGSSDYVEVKSGVVSLNYNMNLFQGSNIKFKEKDKTVVSYDIGYYVLVNDEYLPLATKAGEDDEGLSLKELITGTDNYKIIEPANGNYFFTKDKINNLDSNLFFIIKATDNKNNEIKDAIKLKVSISEIDVELKTIAENASNNTLIVGNNTFNFLKNYGFNVIYIDDSENSNTNLSQAKKLVQNKSVSNLFVLSGYTETDNIKELVKAGITITEVPNLYTINSEQRNNNQDYLFFIKNMVENIKTEVY